MASSNGAAKAAKVTVAEANLALATRHTCAAVARATHKARVAKGAAVAAALAARVVVPTKARPYVPAVDMSYAREVVRLARAASLQATLAMRAIRLADAAIKAVKAPVPFFSVPVIEVHTVPEEGFSAWHRAFMAAVHAYVPATVNTRTCATTGMPLEDKVLYKALRLGTRRGATKAPAVYTLNTAEVRERITARDIARAAGRAAQRAAEAALLAAMVHKHQATGLSIATLAARAAQGAAQREANALRKAGMPAKTPRTHVVVVRSTPTKVRGVKRTKVYHMAHTVESVAKQAEDRLSILAYEAAHKAFLLKCKEDRMIAKAKRAEKRALYIALRAKKISRMVTDIWFNSGVMVDTYTVEACNDSEYCIREEAYKELLALHAVRGTVLVAA